MESLSSKKRPRSDSDESGFDSVEAKRILLDILDDSDVPTPIGRNSGFFLKRRMTNSVYHRRIRIQVFAESVELGELWGIDDQFLSYGSFEYEVFHDDVSINSFNNGEYVVLDGLFDHTDLGFGPSDLSWRPETLPAQ
ncbi:hypothetical protein R6Q59_030194 [Mikania micrantha]